MGTPLPPNEPGQPCALCFGIGQPFGDAVTPKFISLNLFDIQPGQFWRDADESLLLGPPFLIQTMIPCEWFGSDGTFQWFVLWRAVGNLIFVKDLVSGADVFSTFGDSPCLLEYGNDITTPTNKYGFDGNAKITWSVEGLE